MKRKIQKDSSFNINFFILTILKIILMCVNKGNFPLKNNKYIISTFNIDASLSYTSFEYQKFYLTSTLNAN